MPRYVGGERVPSVVGTFDATAHSYRVERRDEVPHYAAYTMPVLMPSYVDVPDDATGRYVPIYSAKVWQIDAEEHVAAKQPYA